MTNEKTANYRIIVVQCVCVCVMEWNGMEWNGMEWNGMEYGAVGLVFETKCRIHSRSNTSNVKTLESISIRPIISFSSYINSRLLYRYNKSNDSV